MQASIETLNIDDTFEFAGFPAKLHIVVAKTPKSVYYKLVNTKKLLPPVLNGTIVIKKGKDSDKT